MLRERAEKKTRDENWKGYRCGSFYECFFFMLEYLATGYIPNVCTKKYFEIYYGKNEETNVEMNNKKAVVKSSK